MLTQRDWPTGILGAAVQQLSSAVGFFVTTLHGSEESHEEENDDEGVPTLLGAALLLRVPCAAAAIEYEARGLSSLPGGTSSEARAINDSGQLAGDAWGPDGVRAVTWNAEGEITNLGVLPSEIYSIAYGINNLGVVAGWSFSGNYEGYATIWHPDGQIEQLPSPPDSVATGALAINDVGQVVGYSVDTTGERHALLWDADGSITDFSVLASLPGEARGINDRNQVVGYLGDDAFIWD